jgi:hypothetical protein
MFCKAGKGFPVQESSGPVLVEDSQDAFDHRDAQEQPAETPAQERSA